MKTIILLVLQLAVTQYSFGGSPSWTSGPIKVSGRHLSVSCHGVGPDKDTSSRIALNQCRSLAGEQILGKFKVSTLSLETQESSGFHQEVSSDYEVENLICNPEHYFEEEISDIHNSYFRCIFDLKQAKLVPKHDFKAKNDLKLIKNDQLLSRTLDQKFRESGLMQSENKQIILSSVPKCTSVIINGTIRRMIRCTENPQALIVYPLDTSITVRATGYQPIHIELSKDRELSTETQTLEVYLEKN